MSSPFSMLFADLWLFTEYADARFLQGYFHCATMNADDEEESKWYSECREALAELSSRNIGLEK